jgi:hypothetical protein
MLLEVLRKIRYMNDTEFNMLCNLLGLTDSNVGQVTNANGQVMQAGQVNNAPVVQNQGQGVNTVKVNATPSVMYPVNNGAPVYGAPQNIAPQNHAQNSKGQGNNKNWHNLPIVSDPNFETDKSYAHVFLVNNVPHVFFIARSTARIYNNVLKFGINEGNYYTIYRIDDYQAKTKTQLAPIDGLNLATLLGI